MSDTKPATVLASTTGSNNTLHIVDDGDGVIFLEAWNGKKAIGIHTTPEAITHAFRKVGLGVTSLQEAEDLRNRVEEAERQASALVTEQAAKLDAIEEVLERDGLEGEEIGDDAIDALQEIYSILHPAPRYPYPTKYGAIIKAWNEGSIPTRFQYVGTSGAAWISEHGTWWPEEDIRSKYTNFETIREGIDE